MRETVIRCRNCEDVRTLVSMYPVSSSATCPRCEGEDRILDTIRYEESELGADSVTAHLQARVQSGRDEPWALILSDQIKKGDTSPWLLTWLVIVESGELSRVLTSLARCGYMAWVRQDGIAVRLVKRALIPLPGLDRVELLGRWSRVMESDSDELDAWLSALSVHEDERWQRLLLTTRMHLSVMECMVIARHLVSDNPLLDLTDELGLDPFMVNEHEAPVEDASHAQKLEQQLRITEPDSPWIERAAPMIRQLRRVLRARWYEQGGTGHGFWPEHPDELDDALLSRGFSSWRTPSQREATRLIFEGKHDGVVVLPTGHGKTLCFDLAAECMAQGDYILVISPLLALMSQQDHKLGERSVWFRGGMEEEELWDSLEALEEVDIALVSPEFASSDTFFERLCEHRLPRRIVLDEAHCVLEWGNGFRPEYLEVGKIRSRLADRLGAPIPMVALTATLTKTNCKELVHVLGLERPHVVRESSDRSELTFESLEMPVLADRVEFIKTFLGQHRHTTGIIRVAMARGQHPLSAESLAATLKSHGFAVEAFHSSIGERHQKELVQRLDTRELQALIATSSFGMGMDLPWLEWVIHAQPSTSVADYLQGAGRAGRGMAGSFEQATCILLGADRDRNDLSQQLYYHLPLEKTLRQMITSWSNSPHTEPENGVYVNRDASIITLDTKRQPSQSAAIRYAIRKGVIEHVQTPDAHQLSFRIPDHPGIWKDYHRARERDREAVDGEWLAIMNLVSGTRCRRAQVLDVFGDQPSPPYLRCCDVCDGPLFQGGSWT